jgi:glycerol kinase
MQLQADTSGRRVRVAAARDLSALGAAHLAGVGAGIWDRDALERLDREATAYAPDEAEPSRRRRLSQWHAAVARARAPRAVAQPLDSHGSTHYT